MYNKKQYATEVFFMKKLRVLTLAMAVLLLLLSFTSCMHMNRGDGSKTEQVTTDEYPNHMDIRLIVTSGVSMDTQTKLDEGEDEPIIGAAPLTIGYNDGEVVTPILALQRLADLRGATVNIVSDTVDSITYDGVTYVTGRVLSQRFGENKDKQQVQYYDIFYWKWSLNGEPLESAADVQLKEGDYLTLMLFYDNTYTDEPYILPEETEA